MYIVLIQSGLIIAKAHFQLVLTQIFCRSECDTIIFKRGEYANCYRFQL